MRDFGKVRTSFWTDDKMASMSADAKLLALYLLTGPHSNMVGCYRLPKGYVMADLGWSEETVSIGFAELYRKGFVERCETTGWTLLANFLRHNEIENPNVGKKAARMIDGVPASLPLFANLLKALEPYTERFPKGFIEAQGNRIDRVSKPLPEPYGKQEPSLNLTKPEPNRPVANGSKSTGQAPVNGHAKPPPAPPDDGSEIARSFHALREELWGITAPPPDNLTPKELSVCRAWVEDGVEYYPALDFMTKRMQRMREKGEQPPERPQFFDKQIREARQAGWPGFRG